MNGDVTTPVAPRLPRHLYTGQIHDPESGLSYYGARYYDPAAGRFLNQDPARDGGNWYAYVGNDPLNMTDPTGLAAFGGSSRSAQGGTTAPWRHLGEVDREMAVLEGWWAGKYLSSDQSIGEHYNNRYTHYNYYVNRRSELLAAQQRFQGGYL